MPRLPTSSVEAEPLDSKVYQRTQEFLTQRAATLQTRERVLADVEPPPAVAPIAPDTADSGLPPAFLLTRMREFRQRQRDVYPAPPPGAAADAAVAAPATNWLSIGPSVVAKGQGATRPAVSGRAVGLAIAPGGARVYVATANGGVWRSDDRGATWQSTMDAWDLNPTTVSSDSLACGAVAMDPANADRVYVGTGEGAGGAYFGVGPIRTDDGGANWITEPVDPASPPLAGAAFYALAVDPLDAEHCIGATTAGLYRRAPAPAGGHHWTRVRSGTFTTVCAVPHGGGARFFAAAMQSQPVASSNGTAWTAAGSGFPSTNVGRIGLAAVAAAGGTVVYALVAHRTTYHLRGVWRLDPDGVWRQVAGMPANVFGPDPARQGQGWYDLAIAVDPNDADTIYLGGSTVASGGQWSGSVFRCAVTASGSGSSRTYSAVPTYIGAGCHADVHALVFESGDSDRLWVGCDGGVFVADDARHAAALLPRNIGLSTLTMNHLGTHPLEDAVLFCGTQDNGTTRYTGELVWLHSGPGDGGWVVVNPVNPYRVLRTYVYGSISRADDGGRGYGSWLPVPIPAPHTNQARFYAPLAGAPFDAAHPGSADVVAFGGRRVWLSTDFASSWSSLPGNGAGDDLPSLVRSVAFVSHSRLYAGTMNGEVYRFDSGASGWTRTPIHAAPLLTGPITEIAIDPADATGASIYVTLGGHGSHEHVWHYDGAVWEARSGPGAGAPDSLLDVHHDAIVVDPVNHNRIIVGADIGVWQSWDGGMTWQAWSEGLPDAAVLDLRIHPVHRVLWAATHGRGVYERALDAATAAGTELYIRDTRLDLGKRPSSSGHADPAAPGATVQTTASPDIRVDPPSVGGVFQVTAPVNFFEFTDRLVDRPTVVPSSAGSRTQVHVLVHNRGVQPAVSVNVTLLLANGSVTALPAGYEADIIAGQAVSSGGWTTIGMVTLADLRHALPQVATFQIDAGAAALVPARTYRLLALLHSPDDPFAATEVDVRTVTEQERKVALKEIRTV